MKKMIAILLAVLIFVIVGQSVVIADLAAIYGDANGDGEINGKDLIRLRKYLDNLDEATGHSSIVLGPDPGPEPEVTYISTADELRAIPDGADKKYVLTKDINLNGTWNMIPSFAGELDGNGHKIFNYVLSTTTEGTFGFFGTNNGKISNLTLADFVFSASTGGDTVDYAGSLCAVNNGTIENCRVIDADQNFNITIDITYNLSFGRYWGGLVGKNTGSIENSHVKGKQTVTANHRLNGTSNLYFGGLAAQNDGGTIDRCSTDVSISNNMYAKSYYNPGTHLYIYAGGFIGTNTKGTVSGSFALISMNNEFLDCCHVCCGGFAGTNQDKIEKCYAVVDIDDSRNVGKDGQYLGGFTGENIGGGTIRECYAAGNVTEKNSKITAVGGFAGVNKTGGKIISCFSTCNVSGATADNLGAFCGLSENASSVLKVYYAKEAVISINGNPIEYNESDASIKSEAKATLISEDFLLNKLYFDADAWNIDGEHLPTLK